MKNKLTIFNLIIGLVLTLSCNQTQKKNNTDDSKQVEEKTETILKKSSAIFTVISDGSFLNKKNKYSHYYSIFVQNFNDTDKNVWTDMESEAKSKPYDEFTSVWFFNDKKNTPIFVKGCDFDEKYDKYCIAAYWHYPDGSTEFKKYPMKD